MTPRTGRVLFLSLLLAAGCATQQEVPKSYQGKAYGGNVQPIPGRLYCWRYDTGGEGGAYHDREDTNLASICCGSKYRVNEGVDVGVTDQNHRAVSGPLVRGRPYVGWIFEGEWIKYTVNVKQSGNYQVNAHMTSAGTDCQIQLWDNDRDASGSISFPRSTGNVHHWDTYTNLARVHLKAGEQVLTLKFAKGQKGDQNFEYFDFIRKGR